jgi:hypothetical protein
VRIRRLILRGPESENPKAQGKPRAEGEKASHKPSRVLDGDSGARANHGSGRLGPVTGCILPAAAGFSGRPTAELKFDFLGASLKIE